MRAQTLILNTPLQALDITGACLGSNKPTDKRMHTAVIASNRADISICTDICIMAVRVWSFQTGGTKLERFLPKNQPTQRKLLNFENCTDGDTVSDWVLKKDSANFESVAFL